MLQDIGQNHLNNGIDISTYLSPKRSKNNTDKKYSNVNNYWKEHYESPCPYLLHLSNSTIKKPMKKKTNSILEKKPKKGIPLFLPYNTRRIDPDHHNRLLIKSNNEIARYKTRQVIENAPGIQRWPEERQKTDDLVLAGKRPLSAARPLSPLRSQTSRPPSGILTNRIHKDIYKSYKYLQDAYESIYNGETIEEENAVAELRAALLAILSDTDTENDPQSSSLSPVLFSNMNHIIALQNFDPNKTIDMNINNISNNFGAYNVIDNDDTDINKNNSNNSVSYINNINNTNNTIKFARNFIENDSAYSIDATNKFKEFIDTDEPSLIGFSVTLNHESLYEPKPSGYTKKLRAIIQDNQDGSFECIDHKANDDDNFSINVTNANSTINKNDVDAKLRQLSLDIIGDSNQLPSSDVEIFGTRLDQMDSFNIDFDVNIDNMLKEIDTSNQKVEDSIPEAIKTLLDIEQSSLVSDTNTIAMAKEPKQMSEHFEKGQSQLVSPDTDDQDHKKQKTGKPSSPKKLKRDLVINTNTNTNTNSNNNININTNSNTKSPKGFESKSPKSPHPLFGQGNFLDSLNKKKVGLKKVQSVERTYRAENYEFIDSETHMTIWKDFTGHISQYKITKDDQEFVILKSLGRGKFAEVHGASLMPNMMQVALKRASYDRAKKIPPVKLIEEFQREIDCMMLFSHANIVKLVAIIIEPLAIVTELMDVGNLSTVIKSDHWRETLDLRLRTKLSSDIAAGLAYVHSKGYIHRDIKPHNIVISHCNSHRLTAKLCDFGSCIKINPGEFLTEECGTLGYTAPEMYDPGKYNHSADVFSFSMVLWQLYSHKPDLPFHDNEKVEFMHELEHGKRPAFGSEHPGLIKELLEVGWDTYPQRRPIMSTFYYILRDLLLEQDSFTLIYDKQLGLDGLKRYYKSNTDVYGELRPSSPKLIRTSSIDPNDEKINRSDTIDDDAKEYLNNINVLSSPVKSIRLNDDDINRINYDIDINHFNVEDHLQNELEL